MIARKYFFQLCFFRLLISIPTCLLTMEFEFPVCSESHIKAEYTLQDPAPYKKQIPHFTKQCNVKIFKQEHYMYNIPAISCKKISTTTTATYYFFGAKTHSSSAVYSQVPSLTECLLWNNTLIATNVGKSVKTSKKVFRSQNKPCCDYHWPTTTHHTNLNAILTRFTLLYNPYNRKLFTPFQQLDHCNVPQGLCKLNHMIFV